MRRDHRVETLVSETELLAMREAAEREELSVSALVRRCFLEWLELDEAIRRNEARESRLAERLHSLDPTTARRLDFGRASQPHKRGSRP